jgi:hypothetical protein
MADLFLRPRISEIIVNDGPKTESQIDLDVGQGYRCNIQGQKGTFTVIQVGEDTIVAIGYVCSIEEDSLHETLVHLLRDFHESKIPEYKKRLVGQYALLVKKGENIFIFTDFIGVRNIFYSDDGLFISSSFSSVEDALGTKADDLDAKKFLEYVAMRHVLYPTWLGHTTYHRHINWLLPYEYIVIDAERKNARIGTIIYEIDNSKETDCSKLAADLVSTLSKIMARKEFRNLKVASSLTGGHDSRLVSAIAKNEFEDIRFRTSVSQDNPRSRKDLRVARKIARKAGIPHDIYPFRPGQDETRFVGLTEGLSPKYNQTITQLLDSAGRYALGFGGAFGTESFMPMPNDQAEEYIQEKIKVAQQALKVEEAFWLVFRESLEEQFRSIRTHFKLRIGDERDYIRLFGLFVTARYSSFIISAFNRSGYQIDPYGSYPTLEMALHVAPALWGNHKKFGGNGLVQKAAMTRLNPRMGRVLSYMHFRPMLSLSTRTFPRYLLGFMFQLAYVLKNRFIRGLMKSKKSMVPGGYYLSDGWEAYFIERTIKKYGMSALSK